MIQTSGFSIGGRRAGGFTLIELVVALTVGVLALGAAPFAVGRAYDTMQYRATVRYVIADLKLARLEAIRTGRSVAFTVDLGERRFGVGAQLARALPAALQMRMLVADVEMRDRKGSVRFYPDGSSTGGALEIVRESGDGVRIDVDWLLGRLRQTPFAAG